MRVPAFLCGAGHVAGEVAGPERRVGSRCEGASEFTHPGPALEENGAPEGPPFSPSLVDPRIGS